MKAKRYLSLIVMTFVAIAGMSVTGVLANSPASVLNDSNCPLNITYVTDDNTVFGPQFVGIGDSYDIKVPTGEKIAKIIVNGKSNKAGITVGTCAKLNTGGSTICIALPFPSEFCRKDKQFWVIY